MSLRHQLLQSLALIALQAVSIAATAQVFRCTVKDQVVYQQAPCTGGQPVNTTGAGQAEPASQGSQQAQREIAAMKRARAVEMAIASARVAIGMTNDEVMKSWGSPHKINATVSANSRREQWVYRRGGIGFDQYVYVDDGVVTAIQSAN